MLFGGGLAASGTNNVPSNYVDIFTIPIILPPSPSPPSSKNSILPPPSSSNGLPSGAIVGLVMGVLAFLIIAAAIFLLIFLIRRNKKKKQKVFYQSERQQTQQEQQSVQLPPEQKQQLQTVQLPPEQEQQLQTRLSSAATSLGETVLSFEQLIKYSEQVAKRTLKSHSMSSLLKRILGKEVTAKCVLEDGITFLLLSNSAEKKKTLKILLVK
jgi:type II secretory pathway pseudopilin PulG